MGRPSPIRLPIIAVKNGSILAHFLAAPEVAWEGCQKYGILSRFGVEKRVAWGVD